MQYRRNSAVFQIKTKGTANGNTVLNSKQPPPQKKKKPNKHSILKLKVKK